MMGHREPVKTGDEYDLITRWRRVLCYMKRPGVCKRIKAGINRRLRRAAKAEVERSEGSEARP
jgi:hypothetical protein